MSVGKTGRSRIRQSAADRALELRPSGNTSNDWRHTEALAVRGERLVARNEFERGRVEQETALAILRRVRGDDHWMTRQVQGRIRNSPPP